MIIYNLAFLAEAETEKQLSSWLRQSLFPKLNMFADQDGYISEIRVLEIENQPDYADEMLNIAVQLPFPSLDEARRWGVDNIPDLRRLAAEKFGQRVMLFPTVLSKQSVKV